MVCLGNECDMVESCEDPDYDEGSEWGRPFPPLPFISSQPLTPDQEDKLTVQQIIAEK